MKITHPCTGKLGRAVLLLMNVSAMQQERGTSQLLCPARGEGLVGVNGFLQVSSPMLWSFGKRKPQLIVGAYTANIHSQI